MSSEIVLGRRSVESDGGCCCKHQGGDEQAGEAQIPGDVLSEMAWCPRVTSLGAWARVGLACAAYLDWAGLGCSLMLGAELSIHPRSVSACSFMMCCCLSWICYFAYRTLDGSMGILS